MQDQKMTLEELLILPWENEIVHRTLSEEDGGGYRSYIPILGSERCFGDGATLEESIADLRDVLEDLLQDYLKKGRNIPLPRRTDEFSGTIYIRTTPLIHEELYKEAKRQGVSINYLMGTYTVWGLAHSKLDECIDRLEVQQQDFMDNWLDMKESILPLEHFVAQGTLGEEYVMSSDEEELGYAA